MDIPALTDTLPPAESAWPADIAKRAAVRWGHTQLVTCPTCHGPALVGYLDGSPVAYACHRCGPVKPVVSREVTFGDSCDS